MTALGLQVVTLDFPDPAINSVYQGDFHQVNCPGSRSGVDAYIYRPGARYFRRQEFPGKFIGRITYDEHGIGLSQELTVEINANVAQSTLSFAWAEPNKIRTLSSNGAQAGTDIDGLLYTPSLSRAECSAASRFVPENATKPTNLPTKKTLSLIAVAPWIDPPCTQAYFNAVRNDDIKAFILYLTDNSTSEPPLANNKVWALGDGGAWKQNNQFPVFAIAGLTGQLLMQQIAAYSGNVTDVPNGHLLANEYRANDYIRLAAEIDIAGGSKLPSLWVFLLIVLGIVFFIICLTSFAMHCIQRSRRNRLRRRVANGTIDLEALGIRRLKVPQVVLDQMPVYKYTGPPAKQSELPPLADEEFKQLERSVSTPSLTISSPTGYLQPTCAICLDDYTSGETDVRELPCRHIFHPECIDSFLRENSSLCPMCKKTVLPKGYCPAVITNAMVRRERMVSRIRDRITVEEGSPIPLQQQAQHPSIPRVRDALRSAVTGGRRVFSAPVHSQATSVPVELREDLRATDTSTHPTGDRVTVIEPPQVLLPASETQQPNPAPPDPIQAYSRREWARQRAVSMLGTREAIVDNQIEAEASRRPRWRKVVGRVWPGMA